MQLSRPSIINVQHKFDILKIMGFIDRRPHTRVYSVMDHGTDVEKGESMD